MKNYILFFTIISLNVCHLNAQSTDKFYPKGKFSLSTTFPRLGFEKNIYTIGLNVRPGYNIYDKLNLGAEFGVSQSGASYSGGSSLYIEPSLKYYLLSRKISPVFTVGYKLGTFNSVFEKSFENIPTTGLGVSFLDTEGKFNLEAGFKYRFMEGELFERLTPYITFGMFLGKDK